MKRITSILLAILMLITLLSGCGEKKDESSNKMPTVSTSTNNLEVSMDAETDETTLENSDKKENVDSSESGSSSKVNQSNNEEKSDSSKKTVSSKKSKTSSKKTSTTSKKTNTSSKKSTTSASSKTTTSKVNEPVINALPGEKLASKVGFNKKFYSYEITPHQGNILIAKTYEEFKDIYDNDIGNAAKNDQYFDEKNNYSLEYDATFFQENALVVVLSFESSGSNKVSIDGVSKKDGELYVGVISDVPGPDPDEEGTHVCAYWRTLIEVKKADIADITKTTRIKSKI